MIDCIKECVVGYKQIKTHKKKRINKKWAKRYGNKPIVAKCIDPIIGEDGKRHFYISPKALRALQGYGNI